MERFVSRPPGMARRSGGASTRHPGHRCTCARPSGICGEVRPCADPGHPRLRLGFRDDGWLYLLAGITSD